MTSITDIHRHPERSVHDIETAYSILDQSLLAYAAFSSEGTVFNIPMVFVRMGNYLYFHSLKEGRFYKALKSGASVSVNVTILDGIVLAKSAFNTSMHYRSVVVFGSMEEVTDNDEKMRISEALAGKMVLGRWNDCRHPSPEEISTAGFLKLSLDMLSVKVNTSGPNEKKSDEDLAYWSGVIKLHTVMEAKSKDPDPELPEYIRDYITDR
jgi:nitroimidazol reductase NimA-like FMN-containing flavoprotein (pyridoxamine 5'-phosphate oxidase superfamily)